MRNFSGIAGSHAWHACVELKKFGNLYRNYIKIALVFEIMNC